MVAGVVEAPEPAPARAAAAVRVRGKRLAVLVGGVRDAEDSVRFGGVAVGGGGEGEAGAGVEG